MDIILLICLTLVLLLMCSFLLYVLLNELCIYNNRIGIMILEDKDT